MNKDKDKLERFVIDHKDEFDALEPNPKLWDKIAEQQDSPKVKKLNWRIVFSRAAAIVVIFMVSYFVNDIINKRNVQFANKNNNSMRSEAGISQSIGEFFEAEAYYVSQVSEKMNEIDKYSTQYPDIKKDVKNDMSELDSTYAQLKLDLKDNVANEQIIEAMIQNYRIKLQILEKMLDHLKAMNNNKKETHKNNGYEI